MGRLLTKARIEHDIGTSRMLEDLYAVMTNPPSKHNWGLFCSRLSISQFSGCWSWVSKYKHYFGYGQFRYEGRVRTINAIWALWLYGLKDVGSGRADGVMDHITCSDGGCVNPCHLLPSTQAENLTRRGSKHWSSAMSRQTHCKHGHELSGLNVRTRNNGSKSGKRNCRQCARDYYVAVRKPKFNAKKLERIKCKHGHLLSEPDKYCLSCRRLNKRNQKAFEPC